MLLSHCPKMSENFVDNSGRPFSSNNRTAILCLGIYLVESHDAQCAATIVPYLLAVFRSLKVLEWTEESASCSPLDRIPTREKFTFCLNTLLSDVAAIFDKWRRAVTTTQLCVLDDWISHLVTDSKKDHVELLSKGLNKLIFHAAQLQ